MYRNTLHTHIRTHAYTRKQVIIAGMVVLGASMLVSATVKETQKVLPPVSQTLQDNSYGEKHSGVGFANYVVGNAVSGRTPGT